MLPAVQSMHAMTANRTASTTACSYAFRGCAYSGTARRISRTMSLASGSASGRNFSPNSFGMLAHSRLARWKPLPLSGAGGR